MVHPSAMGVHNIASWVGRWTSLLYQYILLAIQPPPVCSPFMRVINLYHQILTFHPKTKHYWARCAKNMKMPALLLTPSTTLYYISLYLEWEIINTGLFTKFGDSQKISHNLVKICPLYPSLKKSPKMLIENSPNLLKKSSQYSS